MKKHLLFCFLLTTMSLAGLLAQQYAYQFGKITPNELMATTYPQDPNAKAVIISEYAYKTIIVGTYLPWERAKFPYIPNRGYAKNRLFGLFPYVVETTHLQKTKILTHEGLDKATIDIPFYNKRTPYREELIEDVEAWTYKWVKGEIKKIKLDKEQISIKPLNDTLSTLHFVFPQVSVGDVVEYRYKRTSPLYVGMKGWDFQTDIPVMSSLLEVFLYDAFQYNMYEKGDFKIEKRTIIEQPKLNDTKQKVFDGRDAVRTIFLANNLPAFDPKTPYLWNKESHISGIDFEFRATRFLGYTPYADEWKSVEERIGTETSFYKNTYGKDFYRKEIKKIIEPLDNKKEIVEAIYKFIKEKIQWNGKYALYAHPQKAVKEGIGNNADINALLIRALKKAKIYCYPILLAPRNVDNFPDEKPTFDRISTYIVGISLPDGHNYYIDGSALYGGVNMLPANLMPTRARTFVRDYDLLEGQSNATIDLSKINSFEQNYHTTLTIDTIQHLLLGKSTNQYYKLSAYSFKTNYHQIDNKEQWITNKAKQDQIIITDYQLVNENNVLCDSITENILFQTKIDHKENGQLFLPTIPFKDKWMEIKIENGRPYPIQFDGLTEHRYSIDILLPEEYEVVDMPKSIRHIMADDSYSFDFDIKHISPNRIEIKYSINIQTTEIPATALKEFQEILETIQSIQNKKIIIRKHK